MLALLQGLQRGKGLSYVLITHDVDVIRAMAHQVLVMKDGAIVEHGPVAQVLDAPQHPLHAAAGGSGCGAGYGPCGISASSYQRGLINLQARYPSAPVWCIR